MKLVNEYKRDLSINEPVTTETNEVPPALRTRDQWLVWRVEGQDDQKVPYRADQPNRHASTTDSSTWTGYETARTTAESWEDIAGVGFVFTNEDPFVGIDLDHVLPDDEFDAWARDVIEAVGSFTEISQSGGGAHLIVRGALDDEYQNRNDDFGIEMYETARYFAVTGERVVGTPSAVRERGDALRVVQHELLDRQTCDKDETAVEDWDPAEARCEPSSVEEEMVEWLRSWHADFDTLYAGGTTNGGDTSRDDAAFFCHLAFLTNEDPTQMERIARSSDRVRPKWDSPRGASTWVEREIKNAIRINGETCNKSFGEDE
jgi:primase-polymerase (primpol)-like protein